MLEGVEKKESWNEVKSRLWRVMCPVREKEDLLNRCISRFQRKGERMVEYIQSLKENATALGVSRSTEDLIAWVIDNMDPGVRPQCAFLNRPRNDEELGSWAIQVDNLVYTCRVYGEQTGGMNEGRVPSTRDVRSAQESVAGYPKREICSNCYKLGHSSRDCWNRKRETKSCFHCGKMGHLVRDCRIKSADERMRRDGEVKRDFRGGQEGKVVKGWQNRNVREPSKAEKTSEKENGGQVAVIKAKSGGKRYRSFWVDIQVGENKFQAMVDTGASASFVSQHFVSKLVGMMPELKTRVQVGKGFELQVANGESYQVKVFFLMHFKIAKFSWTRRFWVLPELISDVILGLDFLEETRAILNCGNHQLRFDFDKDFVIEVVEKRSKKENCSRIQVEEGRLSQKQEQQIQRVIEAFPDVLTSRLGKCELLPYQIKVSDEEPVKCKPYQCSPPKLLAFKEIIRDLEEQKIIKRTLSPYASPAFLVKKKEPGKYRLVLDYRLLNRKIKVDLFPLPNIEVLFQFRFKIAHVKGSNNGVADAISRMYDPGEFKVETKGEEEGEVEKACAVWEKEQQKQEEVGVPAVQLMVV
ncbi:uncharacterized protein LOC134545088 [Bacillus rossius redtenbacheri]|uniref:uncharacterized protein LOC134545088 n=1 Tax=Bacillus rossius redtenbacheri TaxID=93214 RepID=UPI002FDD6D95